MMPSQTGSVSGVQAAGSKRCSQYSRATMLTDGNWLLVMFAFLQGASCCKTTEGLPLDRQPRKLTAEEFVPISGLVEGDIALPERLNSTDENIAESGLAEGDIALPEHLNSTDENVASAYLNDETALWTHASVPYRFEYQEGFPVISDGEIERIKKAHRKITQAVPCFEFRCL